MTEAEGQDLDWDLNGNLTDGITTGMIWNWDNKLRSATAGSDSISCKYAPDGSMVYKESTQNSQTVKRKFIVDVIGDYPVILMELDGDNLDIEKTYIHANGQVLMQHDGDMNADKYFYIHDRLGGIRQLIGADGAVENHYTYDPFGNHLEQTETIANRFHFAGYKWDSVTGKYNCNARWYDPAIYRFTGRDPLLGDFHGPMSLHAYLYCLNEPVNSIDPTGEIAANIVKGLITGTEVYCIGFGLMLASIEMQSVNWRASDALWSAGDLVMRLTPIATAWGLMNPGFGKTRWVSQWPDRGAMKGQWVQLGKKSHLTYGLSGKLQDGLTNQFAPYNSGRSFLREFAWPKGWEFFKGLMGQRIVK